MVAIRESLYFHLFISIFFFLLQYHYVAQYAEGFAECGVGQNSAAKVPRSAPTGGCDPGEVYLD